MAGAISSGEWRRHGTLLLPCTFGIMLCSMYGYSLGVLIAPLEQAFGWSRAEITSGAVIIAMIALVVAPMTGVVCDRIGPRRIALVGIPLFCAAFAFLSTAHDLVSWWVRWALLGLAAMTVLPAIWTAAISSVFTKNRGTALAVALCGTSIGGMFIPAITQWLIGQHGWRGAYVGLALIIFAIVYPLAWIFFRSPLDDKGKANQSLTTPIVAGMTAREGFRSAAFLKLAIATIIYSVAINGLTTNAFPILVAHGFDTTQAAGIAGLVGLGSLVGRLGGGLLLDRFDARLVAGGAVLVPILTSVLLLAMPASTEAAMAAAFILGLAAGTELDACAYLASRHFGMRAFGTLFGAINGMMLFANGLAPMLANHIYDVTRSYDAFLIGIVPAFLVTALLFAFLGRYPAFDGQETPEAPRPEPLALSPKPATGEA